jgi:hypothetical protein
VKNHLIGYRYLNQIQTIIVKNLTKTHILKEPNLGINVADPDPYHGESRIRIRIKVKSQDPDPVSHPSQNSVAVEARTGATEGVEAQNGTVEVL